MKNRARPEQFSFLVWDGANGFTEGLITIRRCSSRWWAIFLSVGFSATEKLVRWPAKLICTATRVRSRFSARLRLKPHRPSAVLLLKLSHKIDQSLHRFAGLCVVD